MTVAAILREKGAEVYTVATDATLADAVRRLAEQKIGALLALRGGEVAGVLSERDVVRCLARHGGAALTLTVSHAMSSPVVTITPQASVDQAMELMTERRFRHLPVVEDGRLVGIVSIGDLVKRRIDAAEREAAMLKDYITAG